MILLMECMIACVIFGIGIVGSVLKNKVFWLQEYAPVVQEKFLSLHPEYKVANKKEFIKACCEENDCVHIICSHFIAYGVSFRSKGF